MNSSADSVAQRETGRPLTGTLAVIRPRFERRRPRWQRIVFGLSPKLAIGLGIIIAITLFGLLGPMLLGNPLSIRDIGRTPPSGEFWLGTTQTGQDIFAQLAHATRGSLFIGVVVGVLAMLLSVIFGVIGSYVGGWLDESFSLFTNVMLVIPALPLIIVISSYVADKSILMLAVILAITSWAASARVLRSVTLSLRSRDYVAAARVTGERQWRIIGVEILPNLVPVLASQFVLAVIFAILGEAGLSYLGLGASGALTWGTMLFQAQNGFALTLGSWWWFVPPGLMIAVLGGALSLVNFAIDEIIDPRLRTASLDKNKKRAARRLRASIKAGATT
ncbi:ABC transporter permease [Cryobacterium frigoriphilum]|uniref:ABC transporter permease n=1 Tax=Cryobacterium frigoriphilum TaxID=1259150 RepID=A0A4R9A1F0_9MICO|nr:ABC transporter permease [Cryobacterium frigoriphilum]TFD50241.1 ABC transporter permease [Cryobacterium frigoriphilum]